MVRERLMQGLRVVLWLAAVMVVGGCVTRTMTLTSEPAGALVYLNGREVGRTPLTREFSWYGNYDVEVRKEGYETLKTNTWVVAPWWQWIPLDLVTEILPLRLKDEHHYSYSLAPASTQPADPQQMLERARQVQWLLESGKYTRQPATTQSGSQSIGE